MRVAIQANEDLSERLQVPTQTLILAYAYLTVLASETPATLGLGITLKRKRPLAQFPSGATWASTCTVLSA